MYGRIIPLVALVAACTACSHSKAPKGCAEIHFSFYSNDSLYIGVLGTTKISDSSCFRLTNENSGYDIATADDPVSGNWSKAAAYTGLPVAESLLANPSPDNYVLLVPTSWVNGDQKARIAFGTSHMTHTVAIGPESFEGEKPPRAYLSVGSPSP